MASSVGGGAEAIEHVHEGAEETGGQEVTARGDELAQTDLTMKSSKGKKHRFIPILYVLRLHLSTNHKNVWPHVAPPWFSIGQFPSQISFNSQKSQF